MLQILFGDPNERKIGRYKNIVNSINALEEEFRELVQELSAEEGYGKLSPRGDSMVVTKESKLKTLDELILEVFKNNS